MTDKRNLVVEDLVRINSIEDPRFSPDGQWIAFVRVQIDREKNVYLRNIWLAAADGSRLFPLTRSGKDTQPRWAPDGRQIAFSSSRADKQQIYVQAIDQGGDPRKLTSAMNGANTPCWSPDGTQIAFLASVSADDCAYEDDPENAGKPGEEDEKKKSDPRIIRTVPYRAGTAFNTDKYAQIYVMRLVSEDAEPETPRRLTTSNAAYSEPAWSPDGQFLYTSRAEVPGADEPARQSRGYKVRVTDGSHEQLTGPTHAADRPVPSPDGRYLAFSRHRNENMALNYSLLAVLDTHTGLIRDVTAAPDLSPVLFTWAGSTLYFSAQANGTVWVYRCDPATGDIAPAVQGEFRAERFDARADGAIAFAAFNGETLCELYVQGANELPVPLTRFNKAFINSTSFATFRRITWQPEAGVELEGWYLLPPDYDPAKKYPLVLDIHGGPHIMWSPHYEGEWVNWQSVASAGYIVFFANPRGSVGYGEAFQQAIGGKWGALAHADIMAGLEEFLKLDLVDTGRMVIMGGSYGGYMTAWIIARDHRFKAAMSERGVYNLVSFTGTTDIPSFIPNEFGYELPQNPAFLWEHSPIAYAHQIRTPLLIIHSENDYRVHISEAEQLFALVKRAGLSVEFVRYPREGHELSRAGEPEHRIDRLNRIIAWFDRHVK